MSNLTKHREAAGISQERLAEIAGVNRKTIIRIENDPSYSTSVAVANRIARALEVSLDELFAHQRDSATRPSGGVEIGGGPTPAKKRAASTTQGA